MLSLPVALLANKKESILQCRNKWNVSLTLNGQKVHEKRTGNSETTAGEISAIEKSLHLRNETRLTIKKIRKTGNTIITLFRTIPS